MLMTNPQNGRHEPYHVTRDGRRIPLSRLEDTHLLNIILSAGYIYLALGKTESGDKDGD